MALRPLGTGKIVIGVGMPQPLSYARSDTSAADRPAASVAVLVTYAACTFVLIQFLELNLTPPGFTGRGVAAMPVLIAGSCHAVRYYRSSLLSFAYGAFGALLLYPSYFDSRRGLALAASDQALTRALLAWVLFCITMGVLCWVSAKVACALRSRRRL